MLRQWICATTGGVLFTPKGRAWNRDGPSLGITANTALLSLMYGQSRSAQLDQGKRDRYTCFARSQVRAPSPSCPACPPPQRHPPHQPVKTQATP